MNESKLKEVQSLLRQIITTYDNAAKERALKKIVEIVRDLESRIKELEDKQ